MGESGAYCGVCGWRSRGASCEACGAPPGAKVATEDFADLQLLGGPRPEDFPELVSAFTAYKQQDFNRMVGQCLTALGVESPRIVNLPDGPGWSFPMESAAVFLSLHKERGELSIEAPLVRLPARQRVPLMRAALELSARALGGARFCLRGELLLLRFSDRLENLAPPKLIAAIREVAVKADNLDDLFCLSFSARMVGPEARKQHFPFELLGTPRKLAHLKSAELRAGAPGVPAFQAPPPESWAARGTSPELEAQLAAADGLCEVLSTALRLSTPLRFLKEVHPATQLLVQRAALFSVYEQFRERCPQAVAFLMHPAAPVLSRLWDSRVSDLPSPLALPMLFEQLIAQRAQVPAQPSYSAEQFPSAAEAKAFFRKYAAEVEKAPSELPLRHFLLRGALCELLHRAPLPEAMAARLRQLLGQVRGKVDEASVQHLSSTLQRVLG